MLSLLAEGPNENLWCHRLCIAMQQGKIIRFEKSPVVHLKFRMLVSLMSEKTMMIPELGEQGCLCQAGFNIIATANLRIVVCMRCPRH